MAEYSCSECNKSVSYEQEYQNQGSEVCVVCYTPEVGVGR